MSNDLDSLALQGDALGAAPPDGMPGPNGEAPGPDAPSQNVGVLSLALTMFRELGVRMGFKSLQQTLSDKDIQTVAEACAPVADKYGINLGSMFAGFEVEAKAIMLAGPILWAVATQLYAETKAAKAKPVDAEQVKPDTTAGDGTPSG